MYQLSQIIQKSLNLGRVKLSGLAELPAAGECGIDVLAGYSGGGVNCLEGLKEFLSEENEATDSEFLDEEGCLLDEDEHKEEHHLVVLLE